jgi:hypothetical protein
VVLASGPKKDVDWAEFDRRLVKFEPGRADTDPTYRVFYKAPGTQDGGNGGGGEPGGRDMFPVLGIRLRGAWDFQKYPPSNDWEARFPQSMRFEVCLGFPDISKASFFLRKQPLGLAISANFNYVMIVPFSKEVGL